MLFIRNTPGLKWRAKTENERMENDTLNIWLLKASRNTSCSKSRLHTKVFRYNKVGTCILIKGTSHQEEIIIVNTYTLHVITCNFIKQTGVGRKEQVDAKTSIKELIPHLVITTKRINRKNSERNIGIKLLYRSSALNRYLYSILSTISRIHLFAISKKPLKKRHYFRTFVKSEEIQKMK